MPRFKPGQPVSYRGKEGVVENVDLTPGMVDVRYGRLVKRHAAEDLAPMARTNSGRKRRRPRRQRKSRYARPAQMRWNPEMTYKPYAGIGSRKTPPAVLRQMTELADVLDQLGFTLRSGAAPGADAAFEAGVSSNRKEIFLPWREFEKSTSSLYPPSREAYDLAMRHHPNWGAMKRGGRTLQARNSHQVLGQNLNSPVLFVVAWTPDGAEEQTTRRTGGTGQAIRIAAARGIPVFNLARPDATARLQEFVANLQKWGTQQQSEVGKLGDDDEQEEPRKHTHSDDPEGDIARATAHLRRMEKDWQKRGAAFQQQSARLAQLREEREEAAAAAWALRDQGPHYEVIRSVKRPVDADGREILRPRPVTREDWEERLAQVIEKTVIGRGYLAPGAASTVRSTRKGSPAYEAAAQRAADLQGAMLAEERTLADAEKTLRVQEARIKHFRAEIAEGFAADVLDELAQEKAGSARYREVKKQQGAAAGVKKTVGAAPSPRKERVAAKGRKVGALDAKDGRWMVLPDPPRFPGNPDGSWYVPELCGNPIDGALYVIAIPQDKRAVGHVLTTHDWEELMADRAAAASKKGKSFSRQKFERDPKNIEAALELYQKRYKWDAYAEKGAEWVYDEELQGNLRPFTEEEKAHVEAGGRLESQNIRIRKTKRSKQSKLPPALRYASQAPVGLYKHTPLHSEAFFWERPDDSEPRYTTFVFWRRGSDALQKLESLFQPPWGLAERDEKGKHKDPKVYSPFFSWRRLYRPIDTSRGFKAPLCVTKEQTELVKTTRKFKAPLAGLLRRFRALNFKLTGVEEWADPRAAMNLLRSGDNVLGTLAWFGSWAQDAMLTLRAVPPEHRHLHPESAVLQAFAEVDEATGGRMNLPAILAAITAGPVKLAVRNPDRTARLLNVDKILSKLEEGVTDREMPNRFASVPMSDDSPLSVRLSDEERDINGQITEKRKEKKRLKKGDVRELKRLNKEIALLMPVGALLRARNGRPVEECLNGKLNAFAKAYFQSPFPTPTVLAHYIVSTRRAAGFVLDEKLAALRRKKAKRVSVLEKFLHAKAEGSGKADLKPLNARIKDLRKKIKAVEKAIRVEEATPKASDPEEVAELARLAAPLFPYNVDANPKGYRAKEMDSVFGTNRPHEKVVSLRTLFFIYHLFGGDQFISSLQTASALVDRTASGGGRLPPAKVAGLYEERTRLGRQLERLRGRTTRDRNYLNQKLDRLKNQLREVRAELLSLAGEKPTAQVQQRDTRLRSKLAKLGQKRKGIEAEIQVLDATSAKKERDLREGGVISPEVLGDEEILNKFTGYSLGRKRISAEERRGGLRGVKAELAETAAGASLGLSGGVSYFFTFNPVLFVITRAWWNKHQGPWTLRREPSGAIVSVPEGTQKRLTDVDALGRYGFALKLLYERGGSASRSDKRGLMDTQKAIAARLNAYGIDAGVQMKMKAFHRAGFSAEEARESVRGAVRGEILRDYPDLAVLTPENKPYFTAVREGKEFIREPGAYLSKLRRQAQSASLDHVYEDRGLREAKPDHTAFMEEVLQGTSGVSQRAINALIYEGLDTLEKLRRASLSQLQAVASRTDHKGRKKPYAPPSINVLKKAQAAAQPKKGRAWEVGEKTFSSMDMLEVLDRAPFKTGRWRDRRPNDPAPKKVAGVIPSQVPITSWAPPGSGLAALELVSGDSDMLEWLIEQRMKKLLAGPVPDDE